MARAGSCKIGLKPKPFSWAGIILSNGFDVMIVNYIKPIAINAWVSKIFETNLELFFL